MVLMPLAIPELFDDAFSRPSRLLNQHFGLSLLPEDFRAPLTTSLLPLLNTEYYYRPWRSLSAEKDVGSTVVNDSEKFQVNLDVQQFAPEEITVKTSGDSITIEGKHEEKQDEHGFISRHFVRKYAIPEGHNVDQISSTLSSDGVLSITAPKLAIEDKKEKVIPIECTGPVKAVEDKKEK